MNASAAPVIDFGAFDRHNFGDLLFPHIVSALLPRRKLFFAGLAQRDMRRYGGHVVQRLSTVLKGWSGEPPVLIHAGGELLGCDAWEAAIMLQDPQQAQTIIRRYHDQPLMRQQWADSCLGISAQAPYMVCAADLLPDTRIVYNAVGGVDMSGKPAAMYTEIVSKLAAADAVGVRDEQTLKQLQQAGIEALLLPDPAALVFELFGEQIASRAEQGEVAAVRKAFPHGYLAMQFSADFGDDGTLAVIEAQLRSIVKDTACGIVLFCAGAAPWHDDRNVYLRLAARFSQNEVKVFQSLDIWDICSLIADSHGYCGSSLHGRITAMAYALPRLNLIHGSFHVDQISKQAAYASTWDEGSIPFAVLPTGLHKGLMRALTLATSRRKAIAGYCAQAYRRGFTELCAMAAI